MVRLKFKAAPGASDQLKDGRRVTFTIKDESAPHSTFCNWHIEALVEGQQAGYIVVSWITPERFAERNPTMWHFLSNHDGWCFRNVDDPNDQWIVARHHLFNDYSSESHLPDPAKRDADLARWSKNETFVRRMKEFMDFHVNKPIVDMIRVGKDETNEWQHKGVALALYEYAARWLAKQGLGLYIGAQNEKSRGVWAYMEKHPEWYPIYIEPQGKDPSRKKLDYTK